MTIHTFTNNITADIKQDITTWLVEYIEQNHKFYDYKFPPCPYARSARLKGLIDIQPYESGGMRQFIRAQTDRLINNNTHNVCIMVFPYYAKWFFHLRYVIENLNKKIINKDFYAQYGTALTTQSQYPGFMSGGPYFIVIINRLSDVISGHNALLKTNYYTPWASHHYNDVVVRRQKMIDKYQNKKI